MHLQACLAFLVSLSFLLYIIYIYISLSLSLSPFLYFSPFLGLFSLSTLANCVNSSPPLFFGKFQGFGRIRANLGKFGKFQENSGELSGIQWGFVWRLI